jgi:hypothetical protein
VQPEGKVKRNRNKARVKDSKNVTFITTIRFPCQSCTPLNNDNNNNNNDSMSLNDNY